MLAGDVTEAGSVANAIPGTPTTSGVPTTVDPDSGESLLIAQTSLAGIYGDFAFNGAGWADTLDNTRTATQALTEMLVLQSVDGTVSSTVRVTITGANDAAVIGGATSGSVTRRLRRAQLRRSSSR